MKSRDHIPSSKSKYGDCGVNEMVGTLGNVHYSLVATPVYFTWLKEKKHFLLND